MTPEVVHFSSHPHPFRVAIDRCTNPDCECADVTFHLTERLADSTSEAMTFEIRVDPETWRETDGAERTAAQAAIVEEFLRDYPAAEKNAFADVAREKKETARRIREYRFDLDKDSPLVAFNQIASKYGSIAEGGNAYSFRLVHEGREFFVEDLYCPRPTCHCRKAHLLFVEIKPGEAPGGKDLGEHAFMALLTLEGVLTIEDVYTCTREEAATVASAWRAKFSAAIEILEWRYGKIKEIGRRSLRSAGAQQGGAGRVANDWRVVQALSPATRPGRNDPCPCGSGRKFKRCCGRAGAARPGKSFIEYDGKTLRESTKPGE